MFIPDIQQDSGQQGSGGGQHGFGPQPPVDGLQGCEEYKQ